MPGLWCTRQGQWRTRDGPLIPHGVIKCPCDAPSLGPTWQLLSSGTAVHSYGPYWKPRVFPLPLDPGVPRGSPSCHTQTSYFTLINIKTGFGLGASSHGHLGSCPGVGILQLRAAAGDRLKGLASTASRWLLSLLAVRPSHGEHQGLNQEVGRRETTIHQGMWPGEGARVTRRLDPGKAEEDGTRCLRGVWWRPYNPPGQVWSHQKLWWQLSMSSTLSACGWSARV